MPIFGHNNFDNEGNKNSKDSRRIFNVDISEDEFKELSDEEILKIKKICQKDVMEKVDKELLGKYRDIKAKEEIKKHVINVIQREKPNIPYKKVLLLANKLTNEISGYGPLEKYLDDETVTEIIVEKFDRIVVERDGKLIETEDSFSSEDDARLIAERIIMPLGRRLDWSSPTVDARLPDGSRVNCTIPPIAVDGTQMAIRKFKKDITIEQLVDFGSIHPKTVEALKKCVRGRLSIMVSGGTGSGKSTFLNCLSTFINHGLSIITIENPIELQFDHPRVRRWEARPSNIEGKGEISIRHLVINSLRARPDIIIIGEVRGAEAFDLMQALNTGHDGSMSTLHANNPEQATKRLVSMVASAGELTTELVPSYVAGGIDLIVQLSRMPDSSRKLVAIHEVMGEKNGEIITSPLLEWKTHSFDGDKVEGDWYSTGNEFTRKQKLKDMGIDFDTFV